MNILHAFHTSLFVMLLIAIVRISDMGILAEDKADVTESTTDEAVVDMREKFRTKFSKSSMRTMGNKSASDMITVIKRTEVLEENGITTVTEKGTFSMDEISDCKCVCPKVETNTTCSGHGVTTLKFVQIEPEVWSPQDIEHRENMKEDITNLNVNKTKTLRSDGGYPESCAEAVRLDGKQKNGIYTIDIFGYGPTDVYCYNEAFALGCAWTIFLRRVAPGPYFDRTWNDYVKGFGDISGNFFIGLEQIHALTIHTTQELGIFTNFQTNDVEREKYSYFSVGDNKAGFRIERLGDYSDTSAIRRLVINSKFSTKDKDNGVGYDRCAKKFGMGWWYSEHCKFAMKLSGVSAYLKSPTLMGVRPTDCK